MFYNGWNKLCLTHALPAEAVGEDCDPNNLNQKWRWIDGLYLQNVGSGQCITTVTTTNLFEMQDCVDGEYLLCLSDFYVLENLYKWK